MTEEKKSKTVTLVIDEELDSKFEIIQQRTGLKKKTEILRLALTHYANVV